MCSVRFIELDYRRDNNNGECDHGVNKGHTFSSLVREAYANLNPEEIDTVCGAKMSFHSSDAGRMILKRSIGYQVRNISRMETGILTKLCFMAMVCSSVSGAAKTLQTRWESNLRYILPAQKYGP